MLSLPLPLHRLRSRSSLARLNTTQPLALSTRSPLHLVAAAVCTLQEPETPAEFCYDGSSLTGKEWQAGYTPKEFEQAGSTPTISEHVRTEASACLCPRHAPTAFSALCTPCPPDSGASTSDQEQGQEEDSTAVESSSVGAAPRLTRDKYSDMNENGLARVRPCGMEVCCVPRTTL